MSEALHIISCAGPGIERDIYEKNYQAVYRILNHAKETFSPLKDTALLIIPPKLIGFFYNDNKLKTFLDDISTDSQSNVIFGRTIRPCKHGKFHLEQSQLEEMATLELLSHFLKKGKYPLAVQLHPERINKVECQTCTEGMPCGNVLEVDVLPQKRFSDINDFLVEVATSELKTFFTKKTDTTDIKIKQISRLLAIFHGVDKRHRNALDKVSFHPGIHSDIEHANAPLYNIVFSMLRAIAFPSSTDRSATHDKFSIDHHPEDNFRIPGFSFYRVDVLPPNQTGRIKSGANRLLIATSQNIKHFICYTESHDFNKDIVNKRLNDINKR